MQTIHVVRPNIDPVPRVETLALEYYMQQGWTNGFHGENGVLLTLFGLLFLKKDPNRAWCCDKPRCESGVDAQASSVLEAVARGEAPDLLSLAWDEHSAKQIYGVNTFQRHTKEELVGIAQCIPLSVLDMAFRLLLDSFDAWQGGLSDLFMWNPEKRTCAFIEIKGPGDSLSDRQRAWGEKLTVSGAKMVVCHVKYKN